MPNSNQSSFSISDFRRNDPDLLSDLEVWGGPIVLTVKGKAKYVVQDVESYYEMFDGLEDALILGAIQKMQVGHGRLATK